MIFRILQHSALQDWMNPLLKWEFVIPICCTIESVFSVFPFPSQSCTHKSFNHLILQIHQPGKPWNKKYSLYIYIFHPLYLCWLDINVLARKVTTILAASSQTCVPFQTFSCTSHPYHWKSLCVTRPNEVWNLFPRPHLGAWCMVTLGCFCGSPFQSYRRSGAGISQWNTKHCQFISIKKWTTSFYKMKKIENQLYKMTRSPYTCL